MKFEINEKAILVAELDGLGEKPNVLPGIIVKVIATNVVDDIDGVRFDYEISTSHISGYCDEQDLCKLEAPK